jgi:hypothetical protein
MATYVTELPTKIVILDRKGHGCLLTNKVAKTKALFGSMG